MNSIAAARRFGVTVGLTSLGVFFLATGQASAQGPGGMGGRGIGGGVVGGFGLLWLVLLVGLLALAIGAFRSRSSTDTGDEAALETLRRRYASGDLSEEEFEQRRQTLRRQR